KPRNQSPGGGAALLARQPREEGGSNLTGLAGNDSLRFPSPAYGANRIHGTDACQCCAELHCGSVRWTLGCSGGGAERGCGSVEVHAAPEVLAQLNECPGIVL